MPETQMVELESKIAFQEYQMEKLSSQIAAQQKQIVELEALCRSIVNRLKNGTTTSEDVSVEVDERPPHY